MTSTTNYESEADPLDQHSYDNDEQMAVSPTPINGKTSPPEDDAPGASDDIVITYNNLVPTHSESSEERNPNETPLVIEDDLSPAEMVSSFDRYIIRQDQAKRAIAISLRNRRIRMCLEDWLREEVTPKNILMIGPSGVGKTALVRRAARITNCPFLKVEATKFTEVGYIGRDVDSIPRDLVDSAFKTLRQRSIEQLQSKVKEAVEERILDCFIESEHVNANLKPAEQEAARYVYIKRLREGLLDEKEIEIDLASHALGLEIMLPPGMEDMSHQLQSMMQNLNTGRSRKHRMKIKDAMKALQQEEADKLLNEDDLKRQAIEWVEQYGIVFIDEIDKVCRRGETMGADVSREGVQRDLLPLIEGTTVSTKYGTVRTNHILFIAAGAFQSGQKPSDLIPELQGRLPIRVELDPLTAQDFGRILRECHGSLITQYKALLQVEKVAIEFAEPAIDRIAEIAYLANEKIENIGARRLYTVMERLLEDLFFEASHLTEQSITIDVDYVNQRLSNLIDDESTSHYIL